MAAPSLRIGLCESVRPVGGRELGRPEDHLAADRTPRPGNPPPAPRRIPGREDGSVARPEARRLAQRRPVLRPAGDALNGCLGGRFHGLMLGGTRENFRGVLDALLPRITLLERTDSQPTIVSRQTIRPSGPRAAGGPTLQGVADGQRGLGVSSGVPGDRPPRGIASLGEGARRHRR